MFYIEKRMGQLFSHHNAIFTLDIVGDINGSDVSVFEEKLSEDNEQNQNEKRILKKAIEAYIQLRDICLQNLEMYRNQSCENLLKEAISNPNNEEVQDFTYASLLPNIQLINKKKKVSESNSKVSRKRSNPEKKNSK